MNLELKSVLCDAIRKNPLTSKATEAEVEDEIETWLKGASDHHGGQSVHAKKVKETKHKIRHQRRHRSSSSESTSHRSRAIVGHVDTTLVMVILPDAHCIPADHIAMTAQVLMDRVIELFRVRILRCIDSHPITVNIDRCRYQELSLH
jgi:hypothetical protein